MQASRAQKARHKPLPPTSPVVWRRWEVWGVGLLSLLMYGVTTRWGLTGGDSGELTMAAASLGVAHPPGYPLYTWLGKLFALLPWGTLAWRLNFFSAVAGSGAVMLLFAALRRWSGSRLAALTGAGVWGGSPLIWRYATQAEVFALNNCFAAGLVYLSVRWAAVAQGPASQRAPQRLLLGSALWLGLGLGHHPILLFYGLFFAAWVLWCLPAAPRRLPQLAAAVGCAALGFLPYVHLLCAPRLAGGHLPLLSWGATDTLRGLLRHMLRVDYGTFALSGAATAGDGSMLQRLAHYLSLWPSELSWGGLWLALGGLLAALRRVCWQRHQRLMQQPPAVLLGVLWGLAGCTYAGVFCCLNNMRMDALSLEVQARFYQQLQLLVALLVGFGVCCAQRLLARWRPATQHLAWGACASLLGGQLLLNWPPTAQVRSHLLEEFGRTALDNLPPHALLLFSGDHLLGVMRYLQLETGVRRDVLALDSGQLSYAWSAAWVRQHFPDLVLPPTPRGLPVLAPKPGYSMAALVAANLPQRPIFLFNWQSPWETNLTDAFSEWPWGLTRRLLALQQTPDWPAWQQANETALQQSHLEQQFQAFDAATWEHYMAQQYWEGVQFYGCQRLIRSFAQQPVAPMQVQRSLTWLQRAATQAPIVGPDVYKNLGVGYHYLSQYDQHYKRPMLQAWGTYLKVHASTPQENNHAAAIAKLVEAAAATL